MATDFIMPRMPDAQQNHYQAPHQPIPFQSQYNYNNPQISPLSTSNSPTSPKSHHNRQVRPLYMPAVLRPTEHPSKAPPPKPKAGIEDDDQDKMPRSSGSFISLPGLGALGIRGLSRRSTGDSGNGVGGSWNLDLFPQVKGLPSRAHWKADPDSAMCDEPTCTKNFSYFTRRHHCRRCGNIFCDKHSSYAAPLDENANYNPRGSPSRSCAHCYTEFKIWRSRTNSQASSDAAHPPHASTAPTSPIVASPVAFGGVNNNNTTTTNKQDAAQSVPRDWNWSTF